MVYPLPFRGPFKVLKVARTWASAHPFPWQGINFCAYIWRL